MIEIKENYSLKYLQSFRVNCVARYFVEVHSDVELISALEFYHQIKKKIEIPLLVLGGGSNILMINDHFEGFVIQLNLKGIYEEISGENKVIITANAGENWHEFVCYCLKKNYGGLENLSLIPGNVGASPIQNIGAYGVEIKDYFLSCKVLDINTLNTKILLNSDCKFGYRDSIFKGKEKGKYIILEVSFGLTTKTHKITSEYGAIQAELKKMGYLEPSIQHVAQAVIKIRQSKLPDPKKIGNAGSFFKNPSLSYDFFNEIKKNHPEIPNYPNDDLVKIPAGWLIEKCGWKGKQIGNVACHDQQALVIINKTGNASGREIYDFSSAVIKSVQDKFGIELEREVNMIW